MFRKKFILFAAIGLLISCSESRKNDTITLKLVVPTPADDWPLSWINYDFAERFNKRADNKYKITVHPGGEIVKMPEYFNALRTGEIEMACSPWGLYSFIEPRLGLIETPFILNNQQAGAYAVKGLTDLYDKIFQEKLNQKALGLMSISGVELISTKPVKTMKDWEGLLLGSLSPSTSQLAKALGAAPAVINWTEFYKALNNKVIDGALNTAHASLQTKLTEKCKYLTLFYGINAWHGWSINLDVWKKMPEKYRNIMIQEIEKSIEWMHKTTNAIESDDLAEFKKRGVKIYVVSPAEREKWARTFSPDIEKQLTAYDEFGNKLIKILNEANTKYPYTGLRSENKKLLPYLDYFKLKYIASRKN